MNVKDLRTALAGLPDDLPVRAVYEAGCCESDELRLSVVAEVDGPHLIIDCDAFDGSGDLVERTRDA